MYHPSIVVLFTSFRCNARCVMCSAWSKQSSFPELQPQDIERIFSDRILSRSVQIVNLTGGEPTLRNDLVKIIEILALKCRGLKRIDISTNGINTQEVVDRIEQALAFILQTHINVSVSVSVDGVNEVHDQVRGVSGVFTNIDKTIDELKELLELYPTFSLGINCTINRLNYDSLKAVWGYVMEKQLGMNFTLAALSEIGVESVSVKKNLDFEASEKKEICSFIEMLIRSQSINPRYGAFLCHWLKTGERKGACAFQRGMSILCEPDGSVYRCGNFKDFKIGNLLDSSFSRLVPYAGDGFQKAYRAKCKTCNSNCYIEEA